MANKKEILSVVVIMKVLFPPHGNKSFFLMEVFDELVLPVIMGVIAQQSVVCL